MTRRNWLLAVVVLCAGTGPATAQSYQDTTYYFALDLPEGWEIIPAEELKPVSATVRQFSPQPDLPYVAAFRPIGTPSGRLPLVVVHFDPGVTDRVPFEQYERDFGRELDAARARNRNAGYSLRTITARPTFDAERKRVTFATSTVSEDNRVGTYTTRCLGPNGVLVLTGFAEAHSFRDSMPAFVAMADSVRLDPSPDSASTFGAMERLLGDPLGDNGRVGIVGCVTVIVTLVIGFAIMREKPQEQEPTEAF